MSVVINFSNNELRIGRAISAVKLSNGAVSECFRSILLFHWCIFLYFFSKNYLFESQCYRERERERERGRSPIHSFSPQVVTMARPEQGQWCVSGDSSRSPVWVWEAQALGFCCIAFPRSLLGSWIRSRATGTWAGAHMERQHCRKQHYTTILLTHWSISTSFDSYFCFTWFMSINIGITQCLRI